MNIYTTVNQILFYALLLFQVETLASLRCESIFQEEVKPMVVKSGAQILYEKDLVAVSPTFAEKDTRLIKGMIKRIQKFTAGLEIPQISVEPGQPRYDTNKKILYFRIGDSKPGRLHSMFIAAHEYGHALFESNFIVKHNGEYKSLTEHLEPLIEKQAQASEALKKSALASKNEKLQQSLVDIINETNAVVLLQHWVLPHNELFADLVSVIGSNDGQAITKSLPESEMRFMTDRDFTQPVVVEGFAKNYSRYRYGMQYDKLEPVRSHLWTRYLSDPNFKDQANLLKAFIAATRTQVEYYRLMITIGDYKNFHPPENLEGLNRQLIELIDDEISYLTSSKQSN